MNIISNIKFIDDIKQSFKIKTFIDYIYNFCNITKTNKTIKIIEDSNIYLESERPLNKDKIKIFSVCYFYNDVPKKLSYINGLIENIKRLHTYDIYKDYYLYLYIDCSVIHSFDFNSDVLNMFKEILKYDKVLLQFYYFNHGLIVDKEQIKHLNCTGFLSRFLPFIYNDNLLEWHIRDIDMIFTTYSNYYSLEHFKDSNKLLYLFKLKYKTKNHISDHLKYTNNGEAYLGCYLGFNNTLEHDKDLILNIFKETILRYINKSDINFINRDYINYEYGFDEVLLIFIHSMIEPLNNVVYYELDNINYNDNQSYITYNNEIFNHIIFKNKDINFSQIKTIKYNILLTLYNFNYIESNPLLYNDFKYILDSYLINITDIKNFINNMKDDIIYKQFYNTYHFNSYEEFMKNILKCLYVLNIVVHKHNDIKFIHYYNILF